ncbi:hypothetical protein J8273_2425 [Carpediemonas membranifera]|uniref:Prenyltransferase alpha-alpha toroid domain-containing protein n=1 Tax=Carpediemonas membranifera TaxID=201153 RepID=A0A8J6AWQ6_9EUKA|nr:hypothetical protein J8273_2425 [Carpediemonas membranifera]|eukprot:KAG9396073.1 hypothetical protein J8273_2425 [Carpediemonas membranifera]
MTIHSSLPVDVKAALIGAYQLSTTATARIPGDIPSLLQHAYYRNFNAHMPTIHDAETTVTPASTTSLEYLITTIPPLEPAAQVLLDRARSILTSGPPLSMNVELAEGEELPAALHTLNQGAVWACLLGGGANPDLEDRVLERTREERADETEIHEKIRKMLTPEAKCLWFLCRKFFFSLNVAEKDGESYQSNVYDVCYHHRMYMGRLFMLDTANHTALTRARIPRTLEVFSDKFTHVARTPKGLWGWGDNSWCQLGHEPIRWFQPPTRLTFPACPMVVELEATLPVWEKHKLVLDVVMYSQRVIILTPAGAVVAGQDCEMFAGTVDETQFNPLAVPGGFVPDRIISDEGCVVISMGDRQLIGGRNDAGQLGLGYKCDMSGFTDIPFSVDRVVSKAAFNIYFCAGQILFAGEVDRMFPGAKLLPGFVWGDECLTPTPLRFPMRVKGLYYDYSQLVWTSSGVTVVCDHEFKSYEVGFEASSFAGDQFQHHTGQWFKRVAGAGGAALTEADSSVIGSFDRDIRRPDDPRRLPLHPRAGARQTWAILISIHAVSHGAALTCEPSTLVISGKIAGILSSELVWLTSSSPARPRWPGRRQATAVCGLSADRGSGFNGRTNEVVDGCYSTWLGMACGVLARHGYSTITDPVALQRYLLAACQCPGGGLLLDKPDCSRDAYHTCYNLCGLSMAQLLPGARVYGDASNSVGPTDPRFNVKPGAVAAIEAWTRANIIRS